MSTPASYPTKDPTTSTEYRLVYSPIILELLPPFHPRHLPSFKPIFPNMGRSCLCNLPPPITHQAMPLRISLIFLHPSPPLTDMRSSSNPDAGALFPFPPYQFHPGSCYKRRCLRVSGTSGNVRGCAATGWKPVQPPSKRHNNTKISSQLMRMRGVGMAVRWYGGGG